ncbi:MAG: HAD family hydrolase [Acidobacteriota bacterium]|nr:MAG: HAD family hydrolase [Acidobacteriota bacterium]
MWSGPRNISTALMRSWGNRGDTFVCDEPLYAHYLHETRVDHPGRDEVLEAQDSDWRRVVARLTGDIPNGKTVFYQKHMAHHLLPNIGREWLGALRHAFLIRDPGEMLTSLIRVTPEPGLADTGLPQQWELFEKVRADTQTTPPVIDARDVLEDPRGVLERLCSSLGVPFDEAMLSWPSGPRDTDGVWGKYWYHNVWRSTGFEPYRAKPDAVPERLRAVHEQCLSFYQRLRQHRL